MLSGNNSYRDELVAPLHGLLDRAAFSAPHIQDHNASRTGSTSRGSTVLDYWITAADHRPPQDGQGAFASGRSLYLQVIYGSTGGLQVFERSIAVAGAPGPADVSHLILDGDAPGLSSLVESLREAYTVRTRNPICMSDMIDALMISALGAETKYQKLADINKSEGQVIPSIYTRSSAGVFFNMTLTDYDGSELKRPVDAFSLQGKQFGVEVSSFREFPGDSDFHGMHDALKRFASR